MIRHLAADEVAKLTGSKRFTQNYIGWSPPEMVDRYTHVENWTAPIVAAFDERIQEALSGAEDKDSAHGQNPKSCTLVVPLRPNVRPRKMARL